MNPQNQNPGLDPNQPQSPIAQPQGYVPPAQPVVTSVHQPAQPVAQQPAMTPQAKPSRLSESAERLKKLSIMVMIGGLVGAAVIAVVAVLVGSFNETFSKALFTLLLIMFHALACLGFVEQTGKSKNSNFKFFENTVFVILILSFFTSIFGVWGLMGGEIVGKLYATYFILAFASLHGQMLVETRGLDAKIDTVVMFNYVFMGIVVLLFLPIIWMEHDSVQGFYLRLLAACGIVDGTLTILAVILHRLYLQKHPTVQSDLFGAGLPDNQQKRRLHPLLILLGIFVIGQLVISLVVVALGAFF